MLPSFPPAVRQRAWSMLANNFLTLHHGLGLLCRRLCVAALLPDVRLRLHGRRPAGMTLLRRVVLTGLALGLGACASVPRPGLAPATPAAPPYPAWAEVLRQYADREGRVDFAALSVNRSDLDRFVAYIYDISPENQPALFRGRTSVLAYHLNAYNALALHKVLERGIPHTLAGWRRLAFFYFGPVQVGGTRMNLWHHKNRVIRPLGDPRVHFALNCLSVSCPRLPREPFLPERLDEQLEREARAFFADPRNLQVDPAREEVRVSAILQFYTEDFLAAAPSLIAYINRYSPQLVPETYRVRFLAYDGTINRQPGT